MNVRTVTLEILRHGPPHNQLLSPLTQYLALSGRYQAVTLQIPWEHARFERELNVLRYGARRGQAPDATRVTASDRADIASQVSRIFESVPGLIAGLAPQDDTRDTLTHLRLIFSASELAMVPFELSMSPRGFPGEGDSLSTQPVTPLVMTREIRGATGYNRPWPISPRILFAWADLPDQSPVPWRAHLQCLVSALRPWTGRRIKDLEEEGPGKALRQRLTLLPRASLADIARACAGESYTHIHILAHGGRGRDAEHERFALLLHGDPGRGDTDHVSAERLAVALTGQMAAPDGDGARFSSPAVVTLATCDSGNQADVVLPGASLIHILHAAGIPLTVGSLFPLSKRGSVLMTEALYRSLMAGDDPRVALHLARHALRTADVDTHDWASMVAYSSFSDSLSTRVLRARYEAARCAGTTTNGQIETLAQKARAFSSEACEHYLGQLVDDLERASRRMPIEGAYEIEGHGLLGAKEKRKAQALFLLAQAATESKQDATPYLRGSLEALILAGKHYRRAADARMAAAAYWTAGAPHWVLTQALSVDAVLGMPLTLMRWRHACSMAEVDLASTPVDVGWAHGSLVEIYLLRVFVTEDGLQADTQKTMETSALDSAKMVASAARLNPFIVESTRRQIDRYRCWWNQDLWKQWLVGTGRSRAETRWAQLMELADHVHRILQAAA